MEEPQKTKYLEETPGVSSSMRLMCMFSFWAAVMFGLLTIVKSAGDQGFWITLTFICGAFAPKAVQKFAEIQVNRS